MTKVQMEYRYEACLEAAEHLKLSWTDNLEEYQEGLIVAQALEEIAEQWFKQFYDK